MGENELWITCAYPDCGREMVLTVKVSKPLPTQPKNVTIVRYCKHCNRPNRIEVPSNLDVQESPKR